MRTARAADRHQQIEVLAALPFNRGGRTGELAGAILIIERFCDTIADDEHVAMGICEMAWLAVVVQAVAAARGEGMDMGLRLADLDLRQRLSQDAARLSGRRLSLRDSACQNLHPPFPEANRPEPHDTGAGQCADLAPNGSLACHSNLARDSLRELMMTDTEESAIAAAAMIGDNRVPVNG